MGLNKKTLSYVARILTSLLIIFSSLLQAQPVAQDLLDDVLISKSDYTGIIKIMFHMPVRYISHYPKQTGNEIRIKVGVLNILKDSRNENKRESLAPHSSDNLGLEEVSYEKSDRDQYFTLYFDKEISFEIIQDANYRSLSLIIHGAR